MPRNLNCLIWLGALLAADRAPGAVYAFTLTPAGSGLNGSIGLTADTAGSLQGDYHAVDNPAGTRTKPGLFGSFGATENVPVPVELSPVLSGPLATRSSGSFQLQINESAGTLLLSGLSVDWLANGPVTVSTGVSLTYDSFRTRSPDSLFIGGFPLTLPLGNNELSSLLGVQTGPSAGTLTALGSGLYGFSVATVLQVTGDFDGTFGRFTLPPVPVPWILQGQLSLAGDTATITASGALDFNETADPALALPGIPLALPTIIPSGGTANLRFDLNLNSIGAEVDSTFIMGATGIAIPEPSSGLALLGLTVMCFCRRRTPVQADARTCCGSHGPARP